MNDILYLNFLQIYVANGRTVIAKKESFNIDKHFKLIELIDEGNAIF